MIQAQRKTVLGTAGLAALVFIGIVTGASGSCFSTQSFSAYQKARILGAGEAVSDRSRVIALGTEQDLDFVQFSNPQVGWAGNHYGLLYATEDAGKTWKRRELDFGINLNGIYFTDLYLGSDTFGWAIAQRYNKSGDDICLREGSLVRTSDGGKTWQVQFTKKCVELLRISFDGENEGWVLGHEFVQHKEKTEGRFLVMHTSDRGNSWFDVSEEANRLMMDGSGRVTESPAGIAATGEGTATIITSNGYLLDTSNGGKQWRRSGSLTLHRLMPEIKALSGRSLVVNAAVDGNHGTAGMVARRDDNGHWTGSWFTQVHLRDVMFLSPTEVLVCGALLPEERESLPQVQREGVILHSTNGGSEWKPIFRSSAIRSVNSLHLSTPGTVWAVAAKGQLIEITLR